MSNNIQQTGHSQTAAATDREKPSWTVDLGSFYVNADTEEEAIQEAWKMIKEGGWVEIDQVFLTEEW